MHLHTTLLVQPICPINHLKIKKNLSLALNQQHFSW